MSSDLGSKAETAQVRIWRPPRNNSVMMPRWAMAKCVRLLPRKLCSVSMSQLQLDGSFHHQTNPKRCKIKTEWAKHWDQPGKQVAPSQIYESREFQNPVKRNLVAGATASGTAYAASLLCAKRESERVWGSCEPVFLGSGWEFSRGTHTGINTPIQHFSVVSERIQVWFDTMQVKPQQKCRTQSTRKFSYKKRELHKSTTLLLWSSPSFQWAVRSRTIQSTVSFECRQTRDQSIFFSLHVDKSSEAIFQMVLQIWRRWDLTTS